MLDKITNGLFTFLYPSAVKKIKCSELSLFLTFDDGPTPEVTSQVLKILAAYNAKATFFCLGKQVEAHPGLFKSIVEQGHAVGIHGYLHISGISITKSAFAENIEQCNRLISSDLVRPPYGRMTLSQYLWLIKRYKLVLWDVMAYDFKKEISVDTVVANVCNNVRNGSIIVLHDTERTKDILVSALPIMLDKLKGYSFKKIDTF
ncbi:MAG TPA: polysaccharide deacetylase family protein [Bacteroidales bacterium]|nr:polysaccharide deacetylase family protein [Bacteroidales bacterium]